MSAAYLVRSQRLALSSVAVSAEERITDALFSDERFDGQNLKEKSFKHCTFANVSFLEAELENCSFLDCVFINCYFRLTRIGSKFPASKFLSCDFSRAKISGGADFQDYTYWKDCYIKYDEINSRLPTRLNIRVRLANNLARECEAAGETRDARLFRLLAIAAWQGHCKKIAVQRETSYQEKYRGQQWIGALAWLKSKLQGLIWGYGEKARIPILCFSVLTLFIYPFIFWRLAGSLEAFEGRPINYWDYLLLSLDNILPVAGIATVAARSTVLRFVEASQVFVGVIYAGIFIALLLKAGQRR